jgi:hypothetical protein
MVDQRCPMCGEANPPENEVCQYCDARIKPLGDLSEEGNQPGLSENQVTGSAEQTFFTGKAEVSQPDLHLSKVEDRTDGENSSFTRKETPKKTGLTDFLRELREPDVDGGRKPDVKRDEIHQARKQAGGSDSSIISGVMGLLRGRRASDKGSSSKDEDVKVEDTHDPQQEPKDKTTSSQRFGVTGFLRGLRRTIDKKDEESDISSGGEGQGISPGVVGDEDLVEIIQNEVLSMEKPGLGTDELIDLRELDDSWGDDQPEADGDQDKPEDDSLTLDGWEGLEPIFPDKTQMMKLVDDFKLIEKALPEDQVLDEDEGEPLIQPDSIEGAGQDEMVDEGDTYIETGLTGLLRDFSAKEEEISIEDFELDRFDDISMEGDEQTGNLRKTGLTDILVSFPGEEDTPLEEEGQDAQDEAEIYIQKTGLTDLLRSFPSEGEAVSSEGDEQEPASESSADVSEEVEPHQKTGMTDLLIRFPSDEGELIPTDVTEQGSPLQDSEDKPEEIELYQKTGLTDLLKSFPSDEEVIIPSEPEQAPLQKTPEEESEDESDEIEAVQKTGLTGLLSDFFSREGQISEEELDLDLEESPSVSEAQDEAVPRLKTGLTEPLPDLPEEDIHTLDDEDGFSFLVDIDTEKTPGGESLSGEEELVSQDKMEGDESAHSGPFQSEDVSLKEPSADSLADQEFDQDIIEEEHATPGKDESELEIRDDDLKYLTEEMPESQISQLDFDEAPDWLDQTRDQALPFYTSSGEMPDWLSDLPKEGTEITSSEEGEVESGIPAWLKEFSVGSFGHKEDRVDREEGPIQKSVDWDDLNEAQVSYEEGDDSPPQGVETTGKQESREDAFDHGITDDIPLAPAELPQWMEAMRPVVTVVPSQPIEVESDSRVESAGPLAGMRGLLPAEPDVAREVKSHSPADKLKVTERQKVHAGLLEELFNERFAPLQGSRKTRDKSQGYLRIIVAIVILLAILWSILWTRENRAETPAIHPETTEVQRLVNNLPASSKVLLAFDYDPGFSPELDSAARPVIRHLLNRGILLTLVSTSPVGPVIAERFVGLLSAQQVYVRNQDYVNLGFIPGGSLGLLGFAQSPQRTLPYSLDSLPAWEGTGRNASLPLEGINAIDDFSMILVIVDKPDVARTWIEQVLPVLQEQGQTTPMVMVISAQAEPLIRSYYETTPRQIQGLLVGVRHGREYARLMNEELFPDWHGDTFGMGLVAASLLIAVGGVVNLATTLFPKIKSPDDEVDGDHR